MNKPILPPPDKSYSATAELANWLCNLTHDHVTDRARLRSEHALLDWVGVTIAGVGEPLTQKILDCYAGQGHAATLIGTDMRSTAEYAALINGSASHALDYDDVNSDMMGHPTVAILPAVLAMAEERGTSQRDAMLAYIAGVEVGACLGRALGPKHYGKGFHATATHGSVAASAACAKVLGLDLAQTRAALAIGASQAAGLKSNFGTMTKPFHAGRAAMNGVMAARLAEQGFTARDDILECVQGYSDVLASPWSLRELDLPAPDDTFQVEHNLFKFHAACALTHSAILAAKDLRQHAIFKTEEIEQINIHGDAVLGKTCGISDPKTGLDVKFSIQHVTVAGLLGHNTADPAYYVDEIAHDAQVAPLRQKVKLLPPREAGNEVSQVELRLHLSDGRVVGTKMDASMPIADDSQQYTKLVEKFIALTAPGMDRTQADKICFALEGFASSVELVSELLPEIPTKT